MMIDDLTKQGKRDWKYNGKNTIANIVDFEYILNYTQPVERIDGRMAYTLAQAGGSVRIG